MGGKGGGADTGPMLEYGNKALGLQREQFDYAKQVSQPWLNTGTSAINRLSTMMGLSGGGNESRQSIYDRLAPQYTTTRATEQPTSTWYVGKTGRLVDGSNEQSVRDYLSLGTDVTGVNRLKYLGYNFENFKKDPSRFGLTPMQVPQVATPTVDTAALNAAVDAAYSGQSPDSNFGKLLETYTGQDIYNDPSYQFRLGQGQKAMERQLAASGKYLTPAASQALMELGQNMGSQEYQNAYNRFNNDQTNLYNRLANLSGMGQTQSGQVIGAGQNFANQGTELYTGMGNAITAANQVNNSKPSMFSTLGGTVFSGKTPWGNLW